MFDLKEKAFYVISGAFMFLVLLPIMFGAFSDDYSGGKSKNACLTKPKNAEYIFIGYKIGCWLRGYQGEKYYGDKND